MRVLVLGGTRFIGRWTVERLLADGHDVTLVHRGKTDPGAFPTAEHRVGDRARLAEVLPADASWDAVLDTSGYRPEEVELAARVIAGRARRYVYVSSISAYRACWSALPDAGTVRVREDDALEGPPANPAAPTYGPDKAEAERQLVRACRASGLALFVARPAVVVGPHDYTERARDWLRWALAGEAPLPAGAYVMPMVSVKDVAAALATMATDPAAPPGAYNLSEPVTRTVEEWLDVVAAATGARFTRRPVPAEADLPFTHTARLEVDVTRATERLGFRATPIMGALRDAAAELAAAGGERRA